jgi:hypothetical protein
MEHTRHEKSSNPFRSDSHFISFLYVGFTVETYKMKFIFSMCTANLQTYLLKSKMHFMSSTNTSSLSFSFRHVSMRYLISNLISKNSFASTLRVLLTSDAWVRSSLTSRFSISTAHMYLNFFFLESKKDGNYFNLDYFWLSQPQHQKASTITISRFPLVW